jgi:hypothetical protein
VIGLFLYQLVIVLATVAAIARGWALVTAARSYTPTARCASCSGGSHFCFGALGRITFVRRNSKRPPGRSKRRATKGEVGVREL